MAGIVVCLSLVCILLISSLVNMSDRASYHMKKEQEIVNVYELILDRIYEDNPDYFLDVLTETDEYCNYCDLTDRL